SHLSPPDRSIQGSGSSPAGGVCQSPCCGPPEGAETQALHPIGAEDRSYIPDRGRYIGGGGRSQANATRLVSLTGLARLNPSAARATHRSGLAPYLSSGRPPQMERRSPEG